jgi:O-antigen/teichoic acid export membrane protein
MKEITVYGLHIAKKTKIIGTIVTLATITSLALNLLLIPLWDMAGAAVATLLSQLIYLYACYYFSQKEFFIPYESRKVLVLFLTGSVLSLSSFLINKLDPFPSLVIKISMIACFPFILYLFNFYESVEIKAIKGFVRKWKDLRKFRENLKSLSRISDDL